MDEVPLTTAPARGRARDEAPTVRDGRSHRTVAAEPGSGTEGAAGPAFAAPSLAGSEPGAPAGIAGPFPPEPETGHREGDDRGPSGSAPGVPVGVCVVTFNARHDVAGCFAAVGALRHRPLELVLADCDSGDGTVDEAESRRKSLEAAGVTVTIVALGRNLGFAGGMNAALARTAAPWVLALNADARPAPDYLDRLLARAAAHPEHRVGALTGRLLRLPPAAQDEEPAEPAVLDACGMRLTRTWRHLDRGSGEPDRGQYGTAERVFGATGAASLFRRQALEDVAIEEEDGGRSIFDPRFHSFREDAELAFRLRERGWEVVYEPAAQADHRRFNLPERRAAMPPEVNRHSLKNRYLLRLYHQTGRNLLVTLLPTLLRDLLALGYVLLRERSSLAAYGWLWRHRRSLLARRRWIQGRRTVPARELDGWFGREGMPL